MRTCTCALLLVVLLASCQYPRDPDGTLSRVEGGSIRVGVSESDPWVLLEGGEPTGGAEIELVRRFARDLDARIEWVHGSEEELVEATKEGQVDLLVAGLTAKSRWKKDVAFTRPYLETRTVVAVPAGGSPPEDFAGVPVAVELGSSEEGLSLSRRRHSCGPSSSSSPADRLPRRAICSTSSSWWSREPSCPPIET